MRLHELSPSEFNLNLRRALDELRRDLCRLHALVVSEREIQEGKILRPLTPAQTQNRRERDQRRQTEIAQVTARASERIANIRSKLGQ